MPRNKSWEQVRREADVNEMLVDEIRRLEEAEGRLQAARRRHGADDDAMEDLWGVEPGDDLYLFALARHVAAAGGRLELRAVFDDEEVLLLSEPPDA